jgi:hypothetical protein
VKDHSWLLDLAAKGEGALRGLAPQERSRLFRLADVVQHAQQKYMQEIGESFAKRVAVYSAVEPPPTLTLDSCALTPALNRHPMGGSDGACLPVWAQRHPASWEFLQGYVECGRRRMQSHPQYYELMDCVSLGPPQSALPLL